MINDTDLHIHLSKVLGRPLDDPVLDQLLRLLSEWQGREVSVDEAKLQLEQDPKLRPMQSLVSFEGAQVTGGLTIGDVAGNNVIKVQGIFVNLPQAAASRPKSYFPYEHSLLFQPRPGEFEHLEGLLDESRKKQVPPRVGLLGMGGVGKTQLAIELASRFVDQHRYSGGVFWLTATGALADWQHALAELAFRTNYLSSDDKPSDAENELRRAQYFCRYLAEHQDVLLILDNVEDPSLVMTALPALAGEKVACAVLYTSRITLQPEGVAMYPVEQLSEGSALRLLLQDTRQPLLAQIEAGQPGTETQSAREVCQSVGYLPLALIHLRGLLRRDLRLTLVRLQKVLTQRGILNLVQALSSTFALSWEQVQGEEAHRLFKLACLFPEAIPIPLWLLGLAADLGESGDSFEPLGEALLQLQELSLLADLSDEQVNLHPLVREFGRQLMKTDEKEAIVREARTRLANVFNNKIKGIEEKVFESAVKAGLKEFLWRTDIEYAIETMTIAEKELKSMIGDLLYFPIWEASITQLQYRLDIMEVKNTQIIRLLDELRSMGIYQPNWVSQLNNLFKEYMVSLNQIKIEPEQFSMIS